MDQPLHVGGGPVFGSSQPVSGPLLSVIGVVVPPRSMQRGQTLIRRNDPSTSSSRPQLRQVSRAMRSRIRE
jgi:hypothetical protein